MSSRRQKTPGASSSRSSNRTGGESRRLEPITFSLKEIKEMTGDFSHFHASGKYAKVYRGVYKSQEIAVKQYLTESHQKVTLAENELHAFLAIGISRSIVSLIGICVLDNASYFVMKFVPKDLKKRLKESNLDWKQTVNVLKHLANAIRAVTEAGYVVGDIKPDNILIDEDNNAFLCDFGSAKKDGRGIPTINYHYTAPEIAEQVGNCSTKSGDIFSFGVILLQMITGLNDFQALNTKVKILKQVYDFDPNWKAKDGIPHLAIYTRVQLRLGNEHVVDKKFTRSGGCDLKDAKKITDLGIKCTDDINGNQRPSIDDIISILGELKI